MDSHKTLHDMLLPLKPEDSVHDAESCGFCNGTFERASLTTGGPVSEKTYTEDEYNALAAQVADLTSKVNEQAAALKTKDDQSKDAAVEELKGQVSGLQSELDAAVQKAEIAEQALVDAKAYLAAEKAAAEEAEMREARKDERLAQVKEATSLPEEYLEANTDRFVAMSDDDFEATLEGLKAQKAALETSSKEEEVSIPVSTAMTAARTSTDGSNPLNEIRETRRAGQDLRHV